MARKEYIQAAWQRYRDADKKTRSRLLDEVVANCGCHRKHAIRALNACGKRGRPKVPKRGRPSVYKNPALLRVVKRIWKAGNYPCGKRLKPMLTLWLDGYEETFEEVSRETKALIRVVSASTLDRLLRQERSKAAGKGRCTTKPGTLLRRDIPIKTQQWDENRPGYLEGDTVAHCGGSLAGRFVYTLCCVDIATGWVETRAMMGKRQDEVVTQMRSIEKALPFTLLGFDSDNGSEFMNHVLLKHFLGRQHKVEFTRSRAYKKNDNAHVEQKNWTHVRQWLGYDRLEHEKHPRLLNDVYKNEWRIYHNFFCPSVKLIRKTRDGSKTIKAWDRPKTPYQRLLEANVLDDYKKQRLHEQFKAANPFKLRQAIKRKLRRVFEKNLFPGFQEQEDTLR